MESVDLSNFFQTKSQANDFSERLATLAEKTYETNFNLDTALMDAFGIEKKDKIIALLRNAKIDTNNASILKGFLNQLREEITKMTVMQITIAFEPAQNTLKLLAEWFLLNLKKQVVFDISVDPNLIGGAAITFEGKYVDYSIRPAFTKIVTEVITKTSTLAQNRAPVIQNSQDMHIGR
ncbi:MAG TPA: F0F1 ATP synthase subunit delta [Patescibacteria group bacterium]|nr:F0F1 ATP synthase subunit delta [Patescibacteria group bacterium]